VYTMPGKKRRYTRTHKRKRPIGRGLMQSRPRRGDAPPRAAAVAHRQRKPLRATLRGPVPPMLQRDLLETGVAVYGSSVGTKNPRTAAREEEAQAISNRRGLGLYRREDAPEAETRRAFRGLERTSSGSSANSANSLNSPISSPQGAWNPIHSYRPRPRHQSPAASPGSRRVARGRKKTKKTKKTKKKRQK
jgi:hypothetical protein